MELNTELEEKPKKRVGRPELSDDIFPSETLNGLQPRRKAGRPKGSKAVMRPNREPFTPNKNTKNNKYNKKLVDRFLQSIIMGNSIEKTIQLPGMPNRMIIAQWFHKYPEFRQAFLEAKQVQTYFMADDIQDLADSADNTNAVDVQKKKLQVDTKKWLASRFLSKIYGEQSERSPLVEVNVQNSDNIEKIINNIASKYGNIIDIPKGEE